MACKVTEMQWFSANVRLVCLLSTGGATGYRDSVYLFHAMDFDDAFRIALEIGRRQERRYTNGDGATVCWALTQVISLDALGADLRNGVEVYSEPRSLEAGEDFRFDMQFSPESIEPTQTV